MKNCFMLIMACLLLVGCASGSGGSGANVKSFSDYNNSEEEFLKGGGF